jgi:hypothetical protein
MRGLRRLSRKPVDEIRMNSAGSQDARARRRNPQQIGCALLINSQECVEDGGDQDCTSGVWLCGCGVVGWIWNLPDPLVVLPLTDGFT